MSLFIMRKKRKQRLQKAPGEYVQVHKSPIDVMKPDSYANGLTRILAGRNTQFITQTKVVPQTSSEWSFEDEA